MKDGAAARAVPEMDRGAMQSETPMRVFHTDGRERHWKLEAAREGNRTVVIVRGSREPNEGAGILDAPTEFDLYTATSTNEDEAAALREALLTVKQRMADDGFSQG